jgi:hypothetical protein
VVVVVVAAAAAVVVVVVSFLVSTLKLSGTSYFLTTDFLKTMVRTIERFKETNCELRKHNNRPVRYLFQGRTVARSISNVTPVIEPAKRVLCIPSFNICLWW